MIMVDIQDLHATAIALMARPALNERQLALLSSLAEASYLLWRRETESAASDSSETKRAIEAFLDAVDRLCPLADIDSAKLLPVLQIVGLLWRGVPEGVLREMVQCWQDSTDVDLSVLELRHVAWWCSESRGAPHIGQAKWDENVTQALKWRPHDEIELRKSPLTWTAPVPATIGMAGYVLVPIVSSRQLVETTQHKGVLCSVALANSCQAGLQAWFYAVPKLVNAKPEWCLFGLFRESENESWVAGESYAPREFLERVNAIARSVGARANAASRNSRIRQLTPRAEQVAAQVAEWGRSVGEWTKSERP